jgi:hypothetical protein
VSGTRPGVRQSRRGQPRAHGLTFLRLLSSSASELRRSSLSSSHVFDHHKSTEPAETFLRLVDALDDVMELQKAVPLQRRVSTSRGSCRLSHELVLRAVSRKKMAVKEDRISYKSVLNLRRAHRPACSFPRSFCSVNPFRNHLVNEVDDCVSFPACLKSRGNGVEAVFSRRRGQA